MHVDFPGFNGGDRTTIALPTVQTELMKKLHAVQLLLHGKAKTFLLL